MALAIGDSLYERFEVAPRRHAELLLPMVEQVCAEAGISLRQLDGLGFAQGPGSFTGIRIGAGVIQGLAFGSDLPVVPVSTLATLAQGAYRRFGYRRVVACIDARIGEVYCGVYALGEDRFMRLAVPEQVCSPTLAPVPGGDDWSGIGSGWAVYETPLKQRFGGSVETVEQGLVPHAKDVLTLAADAFARGQTVDAQHALPVYLRDRVVR